jgi:hypothetical protein
MNTSSSTLKQAPRLGASAACLMAALVAGPVHAAFSSGSTGADGALNPTVNTEIDLPASGVLNYTTVNIPSGVTVKFKRNTANTPVFILASGDVTIAGTLDLRGADAKPTGTYGDGALGDDGVPGVGAAGGYDGGRGGREDAAQRADVIRGGTGMGPGGGPGGIEGGDGCTATGYYKYIGVGGGHATNGYQAFATYQCGAGRTVFGKSYGSALLQPLIGGSGGGGGRGGTTYPGSGGGGGGGAILIASSGTLRVTGSIDTTGGDGGGATGTGIGGQGAGGSGGAIRLMATTITGNGGVYANGGCINASNARRQYCGSDGGYNQYGAASGRIRFEAEAITFNGTSQPAYTTDLPGPVFIADAPALRIASVAGQAVPANPTGNADITLPAGNTPIEVLFQTTNVPTGNTVLLRVVPAYGQPVEVLSPAITGSTTSGTAGVSVTLPAGPSTLQATTTYTVVVAGSLDLSRFARNEPVEKVEVTVPMVGEARARLITRDGNSYEVPYAALRAAGFRG